MIFVILMYKDTKINLMRLSLIIADRFASNITFGLLLSIVKANNNGSQELGYGSC